MYEDMLFKLILTKEISRSYKLKGKTTKIVSHLSEVQEKVCKGSKLTIHTGQRLLIPVRLPRRATAVDVFPSAPTKIITRQIITTCKREKIIVAFQITVFVSEEQQAEETFNIQSPPR